MDLQLFTKRILSVGEKVPRSAPLSAQTLRGRKFFSFLVFLLLSLGWWSITSLQERYQTSIVIPVEYPDLLEFAPDGELPKELRVKIEDTGFSLLFNYTFRTYSPIRLDVDMARARSDRRLLISSALLNQSVQARLESSSTRIVSITPGEIDFKLSRLESKVVPVESHVSAEPNDGHLLKNLIIEPDHITIYGSRDQLRKIKTVYTDSMLLHQEGESLVQTKMVPLLKHEGVRLSIPKVQVRAEFVKFTEKVLEIPIEVEHKPEGVSLTLLPSRAQLRVAIPMSMYNTVRAEDFTLMIDYREVFAPSAADSTSRSGSSQGQLFTVYLVTPPEWLINYSITPARIQFIREGVAE